MSHPPCMTLLLALLLAAVPAAARGATITIDASSTFAPLLEELAQSYRSGRPDLTVSVEDVGSVAAANAVLAGSADAAFVDTAPSGGPLVAQQIFALPLAVVISPQARLTALTRAQVAGVFAGGYTSWRQLGGADLPVRVFTRPLQSAMSAAFRDAFGGLPKAGEPLVGSSEVTSAVRSTPGGVGLTTLAAARAADLPVAAIDGRVPGGPLGNGAYPFYAPGYVVTSGPPNPELSRFLAFAETRRPLLAKYGVVSVRDLAR